MGIMQRERIIKPMRLFGTGCDLLHFKPDPKQALHHEGFAIQQEQCVQTAISLHVITG